MKLPLIILAIGTCWRVYSFWQILFHPMEKHLKSHLHLMFSIAPVALALLEFL